MKVRLLKQYEDLHPNTTVYDVVSDEKWYRGSIVTAWGTFEIDVPKELCVEINDA